MFDYLFTAISYDVKELYNLAFVTIFCFGVSGGNKTKKNVIWCFDSYSGMTTLHFSLISRRLCCWKNRKYKHEKSTIVIFLSSQRKH